MNLKNEYIEKLVDTALIAIKATNDILMSNWFKFQHIENMDMRYSTKSDLSPVTKIDFEIERIIRDIILKNHPTHKIMGEEFKDEGTKNSPYLWTIDPIDGTKDFIRGLKCFSTLIAVMYDNRVIVGVSNAPALNETIVAFKNGGAFLNNKKINVSKVNRIQDCFISHGNINFFKKTKMLAQLTKLCEHTWGNRGFEDFRSYHLIAAGSIDGVLEAKTNIWDIAAVSLIVEEAGGKSTDFKGLPINVDSTSIVATNGIIHEEILNYFHDK